MNHIISLFFVLIWVSGVIFAKGFWSTLLAVCIPFWAWYLSIEKFFIYFGII